MYASSKTRTPFQNERVRERRSRTEEGEMSLPVGFPGDVRRSSLIVGSDFNVETIYLSVRSKGRVPFLYRFARFLLEVGRQLLRLR